MCEQNFDFRFSLSVDLQEKEATQQVESTQLAAAEIERLAEDKQRLAEHLQNEVQCAILDFRIQ